MTKQKILLVDDLSENLVMLQKIIKPLDVEVVSVQSGEAALESISQHSFSVIILDVVMPGMDGFTLAGKLKENPSTRGIPLIFITAVEKFDEELLEGYELGAIDFILKPFVPKVLISKLKVLLAIDHKIYALEQQRAALENREAKHLTELEIRQASLNQSRQITVRMMKDAVEAKKLAEENAEQYRVLFQNLPSAFALHQVIYNNADQVVDTKFLKINPAFESMTGFKAEQIIGKTLKEVFPQIEDHWISLFASVAKKGVPFLFEEYNKDLNKYFTTRAFRPAPGQVGVLFLDVTEQKKNAEKLLSSQRLLRSIIDTIPIHVFWKDRDSRYLGCNLAFAQDVGFQSPHEIVGKVDSELALQVPQTEKHVADDQEVMNSGIPKLNYSEKLKPPGKPNRWVKANKIPLTDQTGKIIGVLGTLEDITESKQMQEAIEKQIVALTRPLHDAEEITFDQLFNIQDIQRIQDEFAAATNVAAIITQPDGTPITQPSNFTDLCKLIRSTKQGCAKCMSSDAEIGKGHPSGAVVQPCLSAGLWDAGASITVGGKHIASWLIGQVRNEQQTDESILAYAREIGVDENLLLEAFHQVPVMSKEHFQHVANALYTMANQLSTSAYQNIQQARFIADEERRTKELRRLSTAIEQSPEVIVITDKNGLIEYVNPAFERSTGYSSSEAIGKNPSILKSHTQTEAFYREMWETLLSGEIWSGRMVNKRKDGSFYTEDAVISPVKTPEGTLTNYVAVKRDVTRELLQDEQMQKAQKMEAVGQLAGGIAHDFNNILQTIMGFSDLLMLSLDESNVRSRENVDEIQKAAQHAAELTRQLLAFSRKQHVDFSRIHLNETILTTLNFLNSIIGENIRVRTDLRPDIHYIHADSGQLERAFLNMAINARDAMPRGGVLTLRTENVEFFEGDSSIPSFAQSGKYVCLSICDTGTGISPEVIGRIFEPFFTTKPTGSGTGLGLSASYGIIRKHNGWIDVSSIPGEETIFKIYLPALLKDSEHPEVTWRPAEPLSPKGRGQRILIVEDSDSVRTLSETILVDAGYKVVCTDSAENAEVLFAKENGNFDLLFSDVILPDKNGADLAVTLQKQNPGLQVVLCSGYSGNRIEQLGADLKDYFFLEKPFSRAKLLQQVFDALKDH